MPTTRQYLSAVKTALGIRSDYELARRMAVTRSAVSKWQLSAGHLDDFNALKVAEILHLNPMQVIADANAERAKRHEERERWRRLARQAETEKFPEKTRDS